MNHHPPDLEALLTGGGPRDRERLRRAHDLLLRAGQPPKMPPSLSEPPPVAVRVLRPTHASAGRSTRAWALIAPAAATIVVAAGAGAYLSTRQTTSVHFTLAMHATAAAPGAFAVLRVGGRDRSGNWPITLRVRGLPALPRGSFYAMYLTDKGRIVGSCGVFRTSGRPTVVELNAPYTLSEYSGWLIRREYANERPSPPLLVTQPA
jgi:hypothetical protein